MAVLPGFWPVAGYEPNTTSVVCIDPETLTNATVPATPLIMLNWPGTAVSDQIVPAPQPVSNSLSPVRVPRIFLQFEG